MNQLNALCRLGMAEKEAYLLRERIRLTRQNLTSFLLVEGRENLDNLLKFIEADLTESAARLEKHIEKAGAEMRDWLEEGPEAA